MRLVDPLLQAAGLYGRKRELGILLVFLVSLSFLLSYFTTGVVGMAISVSVLALGAQLEILRLRAKARQRAFDAVWPQVFDSFQNAAVANLSNPEQFSYLAEKGPERIRAHFQLLHDQLDAGVELSKALQSFRNRIGSRHADLLALLIEISTELGGRGLGSWWQKAASDIRQEQALLGEVMAKQGWVLGSAKVALIAPWLIAFVLLRLEQNRDAFASELGALVLFFGLLLSLVAYALVNKLGTLKVPERVFYAAS